ncbi:MAG: GNAT family N-acetyltransferase [Lachnospiraceae bacterium]|nr:GNAT family N-acetyltransferase [Lachnospiraceae bacterium]MCI9134635.1 GNAT family N-acetyltransferase [Lachnospiraceae bacterium]
MMIRREDKTQVAELFAGWQETPIWSCLQGIMGDIYTRDGDNPRAAMAVVGDFCFLAGEPDRELTSFHPSGRKGFVMLIPQHEGWEPLIRDIFGERAKQITRYATRKEQECFDREKLKRMAEALPAEYALERLDAAMYHQCRQEAWSRDLVSQFPDAESYERLGLGVVILHEGQLVSGASSYTRYREGIEIEIDTRIDFRRRGLAQICGARLILDCLERGLYPSWDAHNAGSAALAQKLGYHLSHMYPAYELEDWAGDQSSKIVRS